MKILETPSAKKKRQVLEKAREIYNSYKEDFPKCHIANEIAKKCGICTNTAYKYIKQFEIE